MKSRAQTSTLTASGSDAVAEACALAARALDASAGNSRTHRPVLSTAFQVRPSARRSPDSLRLSGGEMLQQVPVDEHVSARHLAQESEVGRAVVEESRQVERQLMRQGRYGAQRVMEDHLTPDAPHEADQRRHQADRDFGLPAVLSDLVTTDFEHQDWPRGDRELSAEQRGGLERIAEGRSDALV